MGGCLINALRASGGGTEIVGHMVFGHQELGMRMPLGAQASRLRPAYMETLRSPSLATYSI